MNSFEAGDCAADAGADGKDTDRMEVGEVQNACVCSGTVSVLTTSAGLTRSHSSSQND